MAIDWKQLVEDLKVAKELAEESGKGEDGGSANLDTVYIDLPRQREKKVQEEFAKAGLITRKRNSGWFAPCFTISGFRCGQGNSNYRATQSMYKYLKSKGYDVGVLYIMD